MLPSPVCEVTFSNRSFLLKRDDLLLPFGGNKARKLYYFLKNAPLIDTLISYGSLYSNAMNALALLASQKGWRFIYYAPLKKVTTPKGNLKRALELGMELRDISSFPLPNFNLLSKTILRQKSLIIPQGVRCVEARYGIEILAKEILEQTSLKKVFLPSGTGTTALFLQKALKSEGVEVLTTPCVVDEIYLKKQFYTLEKDDSFHPTILTPSKKYRFGRLYPELYQLWKRLKEEVKVEFDLLYDPIGFQTLLEHNLLDKSLLYIHQGGVEGNETMLDRYHHLLKKDKNETTLHKR